MNTDISQSITELTQEIESIKAKKSNVSQEIENFGELSKPKMNSVLSVLIKLIAAFSVAFFFIKPVYYLYALGTLLGVVAIGVTNLLIVKNKNKKQLNKLSELKLEESRLISLISAKNAELARMKAQLVE